MYNCDGLNPYIRTLWDANGARETGTWGEVFGTTTEAQVATISRRDVHRLIADAPSFSRKLLEALADRVRDLDRKIVC